MRHETDLSDIFDDDFEVTYEDGWEDVPDSYSCRRSPVRRADHGTFRRENEDSQLLLHFNYLSFSRFTSATRIFTSETLRPVIVSMALLTLSCTALETSGIL